MHALMDGSQLGANFGFSPPSVNKNLNVAISTTQSGLSRPESIQAPSQQLKSSEKLKFRCANIQEASEGCDVRIASRHPYNIVHSKLCYLLWSLHCLC